MTPERNRVENQQRQCFLWFDLFLRVLPVLSITLSPRPAAKFYSVNCLLKPPSAFRYQVTTNGHVAYRKAQPMNGAHIL